MFQWILYKMGALVHPHSEILCGAALVGAFLFSIGGWGVSPTGKSFRVVLVCMRTVWLPSEIGGQK